MSESLLTVADYITEARVLLQDTVTTYRYSDAQIVSSLNNALNEASRVRPDLFMVALRTAPIAQYTSSATGDVVALDARYSTAILYFIVGQVELREAEDTQDARAMALQQLSTRLLTMLGS